MIEFYLFASLFIYSQTSKQANRELWGGAPPAMDCSGAGPQDMVELRGCWGFQGLSEQRKPQRVTLRPQNLMKGPRQVSNLLWVCDPLSPFFSFGMGMSTLRPSRLCFERRRMLCSFRSPQTGTSISLGGSNPGSLLRLISMIEMMRFGSFSVDI